MKTIRSNKPSFPVAYGDQPEPKSYSLSGAVGAAGIAGAVGVSGFLPYKNGRLWDRYLGAVRSAETAFPGAILRTFRVSEFLSPLASPVDVSVASDKFQHAGKYKEFLQSVFGPTIKDVRYQSRSRQSIFGDIYAGGKRVGLGMQVQAGTQSGAAIADYYARIYGVDLGLHQSVNQDLLRATYRIQQPALPFDEWAEQLRPAERYQRLVVGAPLRPKVSAFGKEFHLKESTQVRLAKAETVSNFMRAKAATSVGRLNVLLTKPFDVPVVGDILHKIPIVRSMSVKPGTASQMAARFTKKALIAGAAWKGLEYYDYLLAEDSPWATALGASAGAAIGARLFRPAGMRFGKAGMLAGAAAGLYTSLAPRFEHGLFHGLSTYFSDLNVIRAKASEATGLQEELRRQEEITPGLMSLKTGLAIGGVAALATGVHRYSTMLIEGISRKARSPQWQKESFADILDVIRKEHKAISVWDTALGSRIAKTKIGKGISKIKSPVGLAFLGGLAAWGAMSSAAALFSGNLKAAIPGASILGTTESAEELQKIYSGEQLVPIRKGRFWEFGRSPYEGTKVDYYRPHFMARLKARAYQKGLYGTEEERWAHDPLLHPIKTLFGSEDWKYHYEKKYAKERPAPLTGTFGEDIPFIGPAVAATLGKLIKPRKYVRPEEWMTEEGYVHRPDRPELEPVKGLGGIAPGAPVSPDDPTQVLNQLMYRRREAIGLVGFAEGAISKALTGREEIFQNLQTLGVMGKETGSEYWLWKHLNLGGAMGSSEPIRRFIPRTPSYLERYNPLRNELPSWMPDDYFIDLKYGNPFEKIPEAEIRLPGAGYAALYPELEGVAPEEYPLAHRVKILGDVAMWSDTYKRTLREARARRKEFSDREWQMIQETDRQVKERKIRKKFQNYKFANDQLETMNLTIRKVVSPTRLLSEELGDTIIELQGIGNVENREQAMAVAEENFLNKQIALNVSKMESRRYDTIKAGPRIKGVAMVGRKDYGTLLAQQNIAQTKKLPEEFERLKFTEREQTIGALSEKILHGLESSPLEFLTPLSPTAKLMRQRSAIEDYAATQAIGTGNAFWDRPVENFFQPAANMAKYKMGFTSIPENIQERRDISEYFDMLNWVKAKKLEKEAWAQGDRETAEEFKEQRRQTLFGVNPYGNPVSIIKALPRAERDYYKEFLDTKTTEEQQQILNLVPENEKRIFLSQWMDNAAEAAEAKKQMKMDTEEDNKILLANKILRRSEGIEYESEEEATWIEETGGKGSFAEWLREQKAEKYFQEHSLPGADWLGWCVPEEQSILMSDKSILAKDVIIGMRVKTLNGYQEVKQIFSREVDEKMITVKTHHNNLYQMRATENHYVLCVQGKKCQFDFNKASICVSSSKQWRCHWCESKHHENYKAEWKPIGNLNTDCFLPIPILTHAKENPVFDLADIPGIKENFKINEKTISIKKGRNNPINRFVEIDESLAWLIGYYLAEGNVWQAEDRLRGVQFTSHIKERPLLELANRIIEDKFGLSNGKIRERHRDSGTSAYLMIASGMLGHVIDFWVGRYCDQKHAPAWLEAITRSSQFALLEGLLDGDATKDGRYRLVLANYELCYMAKSIWEAQGVGVSIRHVARRNGKTQYAVEPLTKSRNVICGESFIAYRIKTIDKEDFTGRVLDFEVENEHMYSCEMGIYHNSPSVDMDDIKMVYVDRVGMDYHDFGLWDPRERALTQKPYINEELVEQMDANAQLDDVTNVNQSAKMIAKVNDPRNGSHHVQTLSANSGNEYSINVEDDREKLIEDAYKKMGA